MYELVCGYFIFIVIYLTYVYNLVTLPDMWERTITIGSAGKTFNATGWKIGWAYGPSNLIEHLRVIHQNCVYTCCTPLQEGLALAFEQEIELLGTETSYFVGLMKSLEKKRDFCAQFLAKCGMKPIIPEGGYFMMANWISLGIIFSSNFL